MNRATKSDDELWNIVAESSFEVVAAALKHIGGKANSDSFSIRNILSECRAATCALQELNNRAMGLKPETLRE